MVSRLGSKKDTKGGGGSSFSYKKRSAADVKKRAEQSGGNFDSPFLSGVDTYRPKNGESAVRILPATWDDHDHYGLDVWMHRFVGSENSNYLCPSKMLNKRCPICEEAKALKDSGEDEDAKKMAAQKRTLVYVLDRDEDDNIPLVWDMSWAQDRDIAALCQSRTGKVLLIDHPDDGFDVTIKRTGKELRTRYQFVIDRDPSPICEKVKDQEAVLEEISEKPLTDVLRYDTAEYLEKIMSGTAPGKDKDLDEDDDKPRRRGRKDEDEEEEKPRRGRGRGRDTEEEEEEEEKPRRGRGRKDEEEEEEEEEKPRGRRGRREEPEEEEEEEKPRRGRARAEPDEEEEEEKPRRGRKRVDEEEEEEEEKPKRGRARAEPDEEEEEEEKPRSRGSKREEPDEEEEEERPRRRRR